MDALAAKKSSDSANVGQDEGGRNASRHYFIGSAERRKNSIVYLECAHPNDVAYKDLRKRLNGHLNRAFPAHSIRLPNDKAIHIMPYEEVSQTCGLRYVYDDILDHNLPLLGHPL